jgi:hypothetical protein
MAHEYGLGRRLLYRERQVTDAERRRDRKRRQIFYLAAAAFFVVFTLMCIGFASGRAPELTALFAVLTVMAAAAAIIVATRNPQLFNDGA